MRRRQPRIHVGVSKRLSGQERQQGCGYPVEERVAEKPDLAEARFLLGKALLDEGNPTAADVELRKAAELKSGGTTRLAAGKGYAVARATEKDRGRSG